LHVRNFKLVAIHVEVIGTKVNVFLVYSSNVVWEIKKKMIIVIFVGLKLYNLVPALNLVVDMYIIKIKIPDISLLMCDEKIRNTMVRTKNELYFLLMSAL